MPKGTAKTYADALKERLDEDEIQRLTEASKLEEEFLESLKTEVNDTIKDYMSKAGIGPSQMAKKLCCHDSQVLRITKGKHGLTMATVAHMGAAMKLKPRIIFEPVKEVVLHKKASKSPPNTLH